MEKRKVYASTHGHLWETLNKLIAFQPVKTDSMACSKRMCMCVCDRYDDISVAVKILVGSIDLRCDKCVYMCVIGTMT